MSHRRLAALTIIATLLVDMALGFADVLATPHLPVWHALFCAEANMVTDGCDIPPARAGYLVTALEYALVVPLGAASIALFTSGLTAGHVAASEDRIKEHVNGALRHHLGPMRDAP
jgi:hypothetical protein